MYHGAYFDIFDDARIETFRRMGYTYARSSANGWSPVVRRIQCEFYAPALMDELLIVTVTIGKLTAATMMIHYDCRRDEQPIALAHAVFAFVTMEGKVIRIPPDLRDTLQQYPEVLAEPTAR